MQKILPLFYAKRHGQFDFKGFSVTFASTSRAGIAQLVERCLAKAKVAGSSPVSRSKLYQRKKPQNIYRIKNKLFMYEQAER
jgi:hypothetical protein